MKIITLTLTLFATTLAAASADQFEFYLNRFGGISLQTDAGKESARIYQGDKQGEETLFESKLAPSPGKDGVYTTPGGTIFTLVKLETPVINDGNRGINSGDWKLTVTGSGQEFDSVQAKMPFTAFGEKAPKIYYGKKH